MEILFCRVGEDLLEVSGQLNELPGETWVALPRADLSRLQEFSFASGRGRKPLPSALVTLLDLLVLVGAVTLLVGIIIAAVLMPMLLGVAVPVALSAGGFAFWRHHRDHWLV